MANDISIEVKGLSQALANLNEISKRIRNNVTRKATREATKIIAAAIKSQTYKAPIDRRTGLLERSQGMSVTIKGDVITGKVKMRRVNVGNTSAFAKSFRAKATRKRAIKQVYSAFYWRFLEKGTKARVTKKGADRGRVPVQPFVLPAFGSSYSSALSAFQRVFTSETVAAARSLPKGVKT